MVYVTSIERIAREEVRKEALKEAKEEACHTVRCAVLEQHKERWGEGQARLKSIPEHARLVQLLTQIVGAVVSQVVRSSPSQGALKFAEAS